MVARLPGHPVARRVSQPGDWETGRLGDLLTRAIIAAKGPTHLATESGRMLEGEIGEINLIERLVELWREQFTGAIRFESDGIIKIIYFKGGDVLSASTNDRADSVDEILMRAGKVSRDHVKQALAKRKENETLGDALLNLGFITRKELTWARRVQVVGVIRSIADWATGSFTIVADYLPKRDEGTLFPLPQVLVELIVTDQDRQKFERAMDGGVAVFAKTTDFDDVFRRLGLNEQAEQIIAQVDGERSVAEVATRSGGETFNAYKLLHALATLGILTRVDAASSEPEFALDDDLAAAGVADAADMWTEPEPEPQPQPTPTFELDEAEAQRQPTIELQIPTETETEAETTSTSAWDEVEEVAEEPAPMPTWDKPAPPPIPMPAPIPTKKKPEEQWGFDEAQLEASRRAAAATPSPRTAPAKPRVASKPAGRRYGLLIALLVVALLAAGGYYGFLWWQGRQDAPSMELVLRQPAPKPQPAPPPATTTTVAAVDTIATTSTAAPPPAVDTAPLPAVTPKPMVVAAATPPADASRARFDAMARDFAANPSGNFTVQIQILCEPANVEKTMTAARGNVWFVPQAIGPRSCYRVFWGRYNTREEAQGALAQIPADLRDRSAAVKPVPKG